MSLIRIERVTKNYSTLSDFSLNIEEGEILGLIGPSGSGKTTLARLILKLTLPDQGSITTSLKPMEMQYIFQDPSSALNPRMTIRASLAEPLLIRREEIQLESLMHQVGLSAKYLDRYPHELSGGQKQRVVIARALTLKPKFLILDEPTSALDATTEREVIELLLNLQKKHHLTYLFITHDRELIDSIANRVIELKMPSCI